MAGKVRPIPEGLHAITPQLSIDGCAEAMELYKKAFNAEETSRAPDPSGKKVWHASMRIANSTFFINDVFPDMGSGATKTQMWLYCDDVDFAYKRAVDAGLKVAMPLADMFWGDRMGTLVDKWGNQWSLAQHIKDMTPEEQKKAGEEFAAKMKAKK
jgi:uncharacterized glyoxalase superfamily protein PhnB